MNWFKKNKKEEKLKDDDKNVKISVQGLKPINYPSKIILAWAKAIEGNSELQDWLKDNGYLELYAGVQAIYLRDEPREWLLKNGYAHMMAMINCCEGHENAGKWLLENNFTLLYHIGRAVDHEMESWLWLRKNSTQDIFMLAKSIQFIKDRIEENHNDMHSMNKDL